MADHIKRAVEGKRPRSTEPSCVETLATNIAAPKTNIWGELSHVEAAAVVQWLFAQPELNLTVTEKATAWDNTM
jgi:primary-amine oxidase